MAMAQWLIGRIHGWADGSGGQALVVRSQADLERCLAPGGPFGILIGVQGGHVLERDLANIARLRAAGVRLFAPAHVMDNALVGSGTSRLAGELTDYGRAVLSELEAQSIVVDLAHMSVAGVDAALPLLSRPFTLSHAGLSDIAALKRNVPAALVARVGAAGGLFGVVLSTRLLGGSTLAAAVRAFRAAIDAAGAAHVGLGSDMDGALKMLIDVHGLPALAGALLEAGLDQSTVSGVMGGNAATLLRAALPPDE
jgi:microsomal dipeptidase-like Zn-dependent dipeptidase